MEKPLEHHNALNKFGLWLAPGKNFKVGSFVTIEDDVTIGDNVEIGDYCLIKAETHIGHNVKIDPYVISSGRNCIGDNCTIRYQTVLAKDVFIKQNCYISVGVITVYLGHDKSKPSGPISIGASVFIGSGVTIMSGVTIGDHCHIGAGALVTKDCEPYHVYMGVPARKIRRIKESEKI